MKKEFFDSIIIIALYCVNVVLLHSVYLEQDITL